MRIGDSKFQLANFSPDGNYVSFVRDNNLFFYNLQSKKEKAITSDGLKNNIINGAPDWVYEEEFALVKGYEWSHDSKCIAYRCIANDRGPQEWINSYSVQEGINRRAI